MEDARGGRHDSRQFKLSTLLVRPGPLRTSCNTQCCSKPAPTRGPSATDAVP